VLADLGSLRLRMNAVSAGDIDLMRALNADEAVMRNLTGVSATAQQTEAEWTQRLQERSDPGRGLSYWIGWHDGAFAGWWGIGACSWDRSTANLGYRLTPSSWGMGLATEGSGTKKAGTPSPSEATPIVRPRSPSTSMRRQPWPTPMVSDPVATRSTSGHDRTDHDRHARLVSFENRYVSRP